MVVPGVDGAFSYRVAQSQSSRLQPGMRVLVSFGSRRLTGFVVDVEESENPRATKSIESVLDSSPVFSSALLDLTRWIADYYLCPWGDVLRAALPAGISLDEKRYWVSTVGSLNPLELVTLPDETRTLLTALGDDGLTSEQLRSRLGMESNSTLIRKLRASGLIDYRPRLKPPTVQTKYDQLLSLSESAKASYDSTLFTGLRSVHQQQLLREIHDEEPEGIVRSELLRGANTVRRNALARLIELGHVLAHREERIRWSPDSESMPATIEPTTLTEAQLQAIRSIDSAQMLAQFQPFLLFGVTGSGKTQVYIEAIRATLLRGKAALVLLPEIALTPFVWSRFRAAFGDQVAIQHSGQSPAVRYDLWRQIRTGKYPVVIGARSAIFAPLNNLGLIIVDEEQEASFKQTESPPCYHARDCALVRARMEQAVIVLGSATPSMESFQHALTGTYKLLELPDRVGGALQPEIRVVNWKPIEVEVADDNRIVKRFRKEQKAESTEPPVLTEALCEMITATLGRGKQAILLQNRRGYAPFIICKTCGHIPMCPNCSVSQTYHRKGRSLRCHYCDHRTASPDRCEICGSPDWVHYGIGTQRLEDELSTRFPLARVLRMDSDTASGAGKHAKMVTAFARHDYDILVGTQMIAKGLDFSGVDLAAMVRADAELFFPDFRASERGASLILQLAGRSGRRAERGMVVIQSATPDHPVIQTVVHGNWREFAKSELEQRNRSSFPPFARLILVRAVSDDESVCTRALLKLRRLIQEDKSIEILGPTPGIVLKIENKFRYCLLLRTRREQDPSGQRLRHAVKYAVKKFQESKAEPNVRLEIDVDPQNSF